MKQQTCIRFARDRQGRRTELGNDRWEFCLIYDKHMTYYTSGGKREQGVRDHYVAVAELGSQGWELVAVLPTGTMYFQRRLA
jgi:hypothetical protein